jgi:hypothetical protein
MLESNFIHLKNLLLAECYFVYVLDKNCEANVKNISYEHIVKFRGLKNRNQYLNFLMIESRLPIIISDIIINMIAEKKFTLKTTCIINGFDEFTLRNNIDVTLKYQLKKMLHGLLFSNAGSYDVFDGSMEDHRVYYWKEVDGELKYCSALELSILLEFAYSKSYFQIDLKKSFVEDGIGTVSFSIRVK